MENSCLESAGACKGQLCKVALVTFTFSLIRASSMEYLVSGGWWQMVQVLTSKDPRVKERGMVRTSDGCSWGIPPQNSLLQGRSRKGSSYRPACSSYRYWVVTVTSHHSRCQGSVVQQGLGMGERRLIQATTGTESGRTEAWTEQLDTSLYCLALYYCGKILKINNLKREDRFIWTQFQKAQPTFGQHIASGPVAWTHGGTKLFTSWWSGNGDEECQRCKAFFKAMFLVISLPPKFYQFSSSAIS